jgi:hypothetical protein
MRLLTSRYAQTSQEWRSIVDGVLDYVAENPFIATEILYHASEAGIPGVGVANAEEKSPDQRRGVRGVAATFTDPEGRQYRAFVYGTRNPKTARHIAAVRVLFARFGRLPQAR